MAYKGPNEAVGPGSSTDNALVRWDSTTGFLIQDSSAILSDSDALSGLTQLDVDNIRVDGNTISSTDTNGNVVLAPDGTGVVSVTDAAVVPSGDRAENLGSSSNNWASIFADGITFNDGTDTLGDYEKGEWTPSITFGGGSTGLTMDVQRGQYTRIGNVCFCSYIVRLTNKGSSTGSALVEGFPFTVDNSVVINPSNFVYASQVTFSGYCSLRLINNDTAANIVDLVSASNPSFLTDSEFTNSSSLQGIVFYFIQ